MVLISFKFNQQNIKLINDSKIQVYLSKMYDSVVVGLKKAPYHLGNSFQNLIGLEFSESFLEGS